MTDIIATARWTDFDAYQAFWLSRTYNWAEDFRQNELKDLLSLNKAAGETLRDYLAVKFSSFFSGDPEDREHELNKIQQVSSEKMLEQLSKAVSYSEQYGQPFQVLFSCVHGALVYLGNRKNRFFILDAEKYMEITPAKDYSDYTLAELRSLTGEKKPLAMVPVGANDSLSVPSVKKQLSSQEELLKSLEQNLKDASEGKCEELAELKRIADEAMARLNEKKEVLMAELNRKKDELKLQIEQLGNQIYVLESEIYAIQCYLGETVTFTQLRSGPKAPDTTPVVLYQKFRFLDEELGRMISLYEIEFEELHMFEEYLANVPLALDIFAPSARCVTLVRLTRNNKRYGMSDKIENMLKQYDAYHGATIGIIIRNGDNLYLGWTDEEKISLPDDLVLVQSTRQEVSSPDIPENESEYARKNRLEKEKAENKRMFSQFVSRVFIFNILQGIIDNSNILPLPKNTKISTESELVRFSMADGWLPDNRFGNFIDIIERCNDRISKGDMILTVQHLRPHQPRSYNHAWCNDRGRGEKNRTHDCSVYDCTLYPINLVEYDAPRLRTRYRMKIPAIAIDKTPERWVEYVIDGDGSTLSDKTEILETFEYRQPHYFVSVAKRWSDADARANFEVYPEEIWNLHYMNSVWLSYVISTRSPGGLRVGGEEVDYAYLIRYLNKALEYIRKRERKEAAVINDVCPGYTETHPDWPLDLSEWKLETNARTFTAFHAKRFLKWMVGTPTPGSGHCI